MPKPLMKAIGHNLDFLCCLISHSHKDHCKSALQMMNSGVDVYASQETFDSIDESMHHRAKLVADKTLIKLKCGIQILCFKTMHDCEGSLGFIIRDGDEYLLFATDTAFVPKFKDLSFNIIAIEVNFDREIVLDRVERNDINRRLADRLLVTHHEKHRALKYLKENCKGCNEVHLLHMSDDNINKQETIDEFEKELFIEVVTV